MSEEIYLYPEELSVEPKYNSRLWPPSADDILRETEAVAQLAKSIRSQGQLASCVCVVDPSRPLPYVLVIGHRRRRAIAELNAAKLDRQDDPGIGAVPLMKVRIRVDRVAKDPLQSAIISNIYEKSYSPMDIASAIHHIRKLHGWRGVDGTHSIAIYLGLHPAVINQYESLLKRSDAATCQALHSGLITIQSAYDILHTVEDNRQDVIDLAAYIESKGLAKPYKPLSYRDKLEYNLETKRVGMRISRPSIRRAIKELGVGNAPVPKSRTDVGRLLYTLDRRKYGHYNSEVRVWARSALEWLQGIEPTEKLMEKFAAMTSRSLPGNYGEDDKKAVKKRIKRRKKVILRIPRAKNPSKISSTAKIYKGAIEI